tara:strand:- start:329 stop:589 length:261 start_codon:yes stop_codon:yes gene_type:complete
MNRTTNVNNRVKAQRTRKGMRQSDLAQAVGVTRQTILAIEKGRLNPSILVCLRIAAALEQSINELFFLEPILPQGELGDESAARRA